MFEELEEKQISSTQVYDGRLLKVYKDDVLLPDGTRGAREYIVHNGASCVVPLTENGEVLMVRQFRYPFKEAMLEVPAGKRDSAEEDPFDAAVRELKEETGATAKEMIPLGYVCPSVAYTTEKIWIYLARGLSFGDIKLDEDEFLNVERIPFDKAVDMVMSGEITDSKTVAALLKANYYLGEKK